MNLHAQIKPIPFLYRSVIAQEKPKYLKKKSKLQIGLTNRHQKLYHHKNVSRLWLLSSFQNPKFRKNLDCLKTFSSVKSLNLQFLFNEGRLRIVYKLMKRYKKLIKLTISASNLKKWSIKCSFWLGKIIRIAKSVQSINFFQTPPNVEFEDLSRVITNVSKMKNIKNLRLVLNIGDNSKDSIDKIYKLLSSNEQLEHLDLDVNYYYRNNFASIIFEKSSALRCLKKFYFHVSSEMTNIASNSSINLSRFFTEHQLLESFQLEMKLDKTMIQSLEFDQAKNLKYLTLEPYDADDLTDEDFAVWMRRLTKCKELKEIHLKLQQCHNLTDNSIQRLAEALESLPNLQSLFLQLNEIPSNFSWAINFGQQTPHLDSEPKVTQFSILSVQHIAKSIITMKKLTNLELNFPNIKGDCDEEINNLLCNVSKIQSLRELRIYLTSCDVTNHVFRGLKKCLISLIYLESLTFWLNDCQNVTLDFLESLSNFFVKSSSNLNYLSFLWVMVPKTNVQSEDIEVYRTKIKKYVSRCIVIIEN